MVGRDYRNQKSEAVVISNKREVVMDVALASPWPAKRTRGSTRHHRESPMNRLGAPGGSMDR
jgi:hypothetical protein